MVSLSTEFTTKELKKNDTCGFKERKEKSLRTWETASLVMKGKCVFKDKARDSIIERKFPTPFHLCK
jgi:hypothetical protein